MDHFRMIVEEKNEQLFVGIKSRFHYAVNVL
jgi:hypothetical protein